MKERKSREKKTHDKVKKKIRYTKQKQKQTNKNE